MMKKKAICLDPGHPSFFKDGSINWGAVSTDGTREVEINLLISQLLKSQLENFGYKAFLTRRDNVRVVDNVERILMAKKENADLIIRLHCDQDRDGDTSKRGVRTFLPPPKAKNIYRRSTEIAEIIHQAVVLETELPDGGVVDETRANIDPQIGMLVGTREANKYKIPTVLIEMIYLSNPEDTEWIKNADNRDRMAVSLAIGVHRVFKKEL